MGKNSKAKQIICFCNNISKDVIQEAIKTGAHTLNEIYDKTTAGVGPCGGSCRRRIAPMLEEYLASGNFPEDENPSSAGPKKSSSGSGASG